MSTRQINEGAATKPSAPSQAAQPGVSWLSKLIGVQGPLIGLVVLCIFFSFSTSGAFFSVRNALNVLDQVTVLGILSLGMTAVIISGGIDLSVGLGPGFCYDGDGLAKPRLWVAPAACDPGGPHRRRRLWSR